MQYEIRVRCNLRWHTRYMYVYMVVSIKYIFYRFYTRKTLHIFMADKSLKAAAGGTTASFTDDARHLQRWGRRCRTLRPDLTICVRGLCSRYPPPSVHHPTSKDRHCTQARTHFRYIQLCKIFSQITQLIFIKLHLLQC